ncbi:MAG: biotin synthase BioB [Puniceicoccales bacterium]|jgi:biotin synthase|nr:biotin synthase BioB [Puniceicoccales bacterium]
MDSGSYIRENGVTFEEAKAIFDKPFLELIYEAQGIHRRRCNFGEIQMSSLLSLQWGGCCEDCAYCAQSIRDGRKMPKQAIRDLSVIVTAAERAKAMGSSRFCMGASGRSPSDEILTMACEAVRAVKELGLEVCLTMGMLNEGQVMKLKESGLDYYNHNVDTSPDYYGKIITTRTIGERIRTIELVHRHGIKVCTGGILGMGETNDDRIKLMVLLANFGEQPESVSINRLVKIPGTPLVDAVEIDPFDFVRTIALARILMPEATIRISAGRETMGDELQALCFLAGASSFFIGEKLLTVENAVVTKDLALLSRLDLKPVGCK